MAEDNVVDLPVITRLPINPAKVLRKASKRSFSRVMVIGITEDGSEFFASSDPDGGTCLWDMERCRHKLMKIADEAD